MPRLSPTSVMALISLSVRPKKVWPMCQDYNAYRLLSRVKLRWCLREHTTEKSVLWLLTMTWMWLVTVQKTHRLSREKNFLTMSGCLKMAIRWLKKWWKRRLKRLANPSKIKFLQLRRLVPLLSVLLCSHRYQWLARVKWDQLWLSVRMDSQIRDLVPTTRQRLRNKFKRWTSFTKEWDSLQNRRVSQLT